MKRTQYVIIITVVFYAILLWNTELNGEIASKKGNSSMIMPSKKAISGSNLYKANAAYEDLNFAMATYYYEAYIKKHAQTENAILSKLADSYWQMHDYRNALRIYQNIYPESSKKVSDIERFRIGELYARRENYAKAAQWLDGLEFYRSKRLGYSPDIISAMKKDSLNWTVCMLNINSEFRDFCPYIVDSMLLFSSNRPLTVRKEAAGRDGESYIHLWRVPISKINCGTPDTIGKHRMKYKKAKRLSAIYEGSDTPIDKNVTGSFLNKQYVAGTVSAPGSLISGLNDIPFNSGSVSVDKNHYVYFSSNYSQKQIKGGINRIHILTGEYNDGHIEKIHSLPFGIFDVYSVMHPAVNADGTIMIFSSDKPGGEGGYDLYVTRRETNTGLWSEITLLSSAINTHGNEIFPVITSNNYLYFSSDGKQGLGGLDIYRISLQNVMDGTKEPEHLPYPVNSSGDDFGWSQDNEALQAYFTSDRMTDKDNIYCVKYTGPYNRGLSMQPVIEGFVLDRQTMEPLSEVPVFMLDERKKEVWMTKTDYNGKYYFPLPQANANIVIKAMAKGFSCDCLTMNDINPNGNSTVKASYDLLLDKYPVNYKWELKNIYYNFDKSDIRSDAFPVLDSLVKILKTYPIKVELSSHTDSRGSAEYNMLLSQRRAESAVRYIQSKGVNPSRIIAKGYGKSKPVNRCQDGVHCSESEYQLNRRTEIKVIVGNSVNMPENFDPSSFETGKPYELNRFPLYFFRCGK